MRPSIALAFRAASQSDLFMIRVLWRAPSSCEGSLHEKPALDGSGRAVPVSDGKTYMPISLPE
jgi:hypothetical protein